MGSIKGLFGNGSNDYKITMAARAGALYMLVRNHEEGDPSKDDQ